MLGLFSGSDVRSVTIRLLAEVREQGTGNREQKEELRLKASKTLYF
jgi:hypothetical protein